MAETNNVDQNTDGGEIYTMSEVMQIEQDLQDNAFAVLGAADDKNCSYVEGYVKRQALYACLTCIPEAYSDPTKTAGVCLACSYQCHDGHELVELYTKRNFRCDCGNSKFPGISCNLINTKTEGNELNSYNQNFSGLYCTCQRPYPDPEDPVQDEMIQCIVCEDWFHTRHLGVQLPECYAEMTCVDCTKKHMFLLNYAGLAITKLTLSETDKDIEITENKNEENGILETQPSEVLEIPKLDTEICTEEANASTEVCKMLSLTPDVICAQFWQDVSWRESLCTCKKCLKMYEDQKVSFLIDPQDTVQFYEAKGKTKALEYCERGKELEEKMINSLPRIPLMETMAAYNDMKENLHEYLKKFAENKKVVRAEDIKEFFANMDARKKQKTDIAFFCG